MPATADAVAAALDAVRAAVDKHAADPVILDVADLLGLVDLFVLVTGNNEPQMKAILEEVERLLKQDRERRPERREGTVGSGWSLLDYGDIVVHVFNPEQRAYYDLERLWADVPRRAADDGEIIESDARPPVVIDVGGEA
ncbi:MAG: ribosome silencing factor [Nitriliruptorales bacterium]|nr:ribosome silencing factor [Nitriliruptorales bacterium]